MALVDINNSGPARRRLTSVLALDICGYSALSERDEDVAIKTVHRVTELLEQVAASRHGRIFHKAGDGFLAEFTSANACLNGALDILSRVQDDALLQANKIEVRIGLHVGDVADQGDGDLLGHGVNIAARLQGEAEPNGILASANLMNLVSDSFTGQKRRRGPLSLKNISEPVEAFDIAVKTGPFRRFAKRIWRPIRRNMVATGLAVIVLAGAFLAPSLTGGNASAIEARVDNIMSEQFSARAASTIESDYVRSVLKRLGESDIPSFQASFDMVEAGNIRAAIERMESRLIDLSPADPDYEATLHLIGALAYQHEPQKAVATYETLLTVTPDDVVAQVYRGRALATLGDVKASNAQFLAALSNPKLAADERLRLRLNVAFNQTTMGQSETGVEMLRALEGDVKADGSPAILAAYQTEMGIALERIDRLDEAEGALIMAVDMNIKHGFNHDLERAYNVLGFIAEKRADLSAKHSSDYLASAEAFYARQFEISQRIDKKRGMAAALYYRGDIQRRLLNYDAAEATLLRSFKIAREENLNTYEMLARLGLAELALDQADKKKACTQYAQASIIAKQREGRIGPRTTLRLARFDCPT